MKSKPRNTRRMESYRGKTIQTATGVTFDMMDLAQRACLRSRRWLSGLPEAASTSCEGLTSDEERLARRDAIHHRECGIIIARLKAELFKTKCLAYLKRKYLRGIETPDAADWLDAIAFSGGGAISEQRNTAVAK